MSVVGGVVLIPNAPCAGLFTLSWRRKRSSLARGDVATSQRVLSSGDPFARHIAEGIGIPLGGLLQLDLVVHDYAADGFVGLFGFILEAGSEE